MKGYHMMEQIGMSITSEEKKLLIEEAHKKTLDTGKNVSIGKLLREQLLPYLVSLRNGTSPDIKQPTKQPDIEQSPKDRHNMDFSDLDLG